RDAAPQRLLGGRDDRRAVTAAAIASLDTTAGIDAVLREGAMGAVALATAAVAPLEAGLPRQEAARVVPAPELLTARGRGVAALTEALAGSAAEAGLALRGAAGGEV